MVVLVLSISGSDCNVDAGGCILVLVADAVNYPCGVTLGDALRITSCSALPNTRCRTVNRRRARWLGKDATDTPRM